MLQLTRETKERVQTSLSSKLVPKMTNMRMREMMNSITRDWASDPDETVPKCASGVTSNSKVRVQLARIEFRHYTTILWAGIVVGHVSKSDSSYSIQIRGFRSNQIRSDGS